MAKVLVVDDDPDVTEACSLILEKEGHEVSCAHSREEGMKSVAGYQPDIMILDVMMEQADDGMRMAQDLRREGFEKPILMLTSISKVTGMDFSEGSPVVPVDEFVEKPVDPGVLVEKINGLLQKEEG